MTLLFVSVLRRSPRRAPRCAARGRTTTRAPRRSGALAAAVAVLTTSACAVFGSGAGGARDPGGDAPRAVAAEPIPEVAFAPEIDVDSLAAALLACSDTLPRTLLPAHEAEIREWLGRLEYGDPDLLPLGRDHDRFFRRYRGRLLHALGWSAFRRGDLRQAEAALVSAVDEIHSRGTTTGYARHFLDLGRVHAARGRWRAATEAFLAAEVRGLGGEATDELEAAHRRWRGSLRGLDALRDRELERVEDERRQLVVAEPETRPLPRFAWPRRTGPPLASAELVGAPAVLAVWTAGCHGCARWADALAPLATALGERGGMLVGVWLGEDPAGAGEARPFPVLVPDDPRVARALLGVGPLPALVVVDAAGRIRYRHGGSDATPPPVEDVILQIDHLERRRR